MRILYLDCFSGISGDMTLASLIHLGADRNYVEDELRKLPLDPFSLEWTTVVKKGVSALKLNVLVDPAFEPKNHRHYAEIAEMIEKAGFSERVRVLSQAIFAKIGAAEAKIHNIPVEQVHFHEVGAVDSIVDAVGVALAIDALDVSEIVSSPVPLGSGFVRCNHGLYPVPAPATLEMMKGLPIAESGVEYELTTPTGAGIISGIVDRFSRSIPPMTVHAIGYGAGTRDLPDQPNVLRAVLGIRDSAAHQHRHQHAHSHYQFAHENDQPHDHHHQKPHHEKHDEKGHHRHDHHQDHHHRHRHEH